MDNENKVLDKIQFIRKLCNEKMENEILEVEQNFLEFLLVIKEIADRLEAEGKTLADFEN